MMNSQEAGSQNWFADTKFCPVECRYYSIYSGGENSVYQAKRVKWSSIFVGRHLLDLGPTGVTGVRGAFSIQLCHMAVWRDAQTLAEAGSLPAPPGDIRA